MKLLGLFMVVISVLMFSGCGNEKTENEHERKTDINSELVREQGTEVVSLDLNKDGMVYQCPMDYQVIADSLDSCPVCKMDLEEYSVADAQKNLESHYHQ